MADEVQLIIFDCDGVLIESEIVVCRIAAEELTRLGYPITTEQVIDRFAGRPDREMRAEIEADMGRPLPKDYKFCVDRRTEEAYREELRIMAGVHEALDAIDKPICVASSSFPEKLKMGLQQVGLYDRFAPNVISATSVARGKPEPDVFIFAAGWMHVPPAKCLVIEDSVPGVRSAVRAGMRVFGFTGGAHSRPGHGSSLASAGADLVFGQMAKLPDLVRPAQDWAAMLVDI
jgi:HAD superfamily hydrolase (TIGR01509 family)